MAKKKSKGKNPLPKKGKGKKPPKSMKSMPQGGSGPRCK